MPELQGYTGEKQETYTLPTTENKAPEDQVIVTLSFRPANGSDFRLFNDGDDEITQAEKILVSRVSSWNLTEQGQPIPVERLWNILQADDIKFLVSKIKDNLAAIKAEGEDQKKTDSSNSLNTSAA